MEIEKLIKENIEFLQNYLPNIISAIDELVEFLAKNEESNALVVLPKIIEALSWSINSISSLERLGIVNNIGISKLNEFLYEVENAMMVSDYVIVSDLFEYEIRPFVQDWIEKVKNKNGD